MSFRLDAEFIGIPYLDRGRDPNVGLDCWGLPMYFYRRVFGIELPTLLEGYDSSKDSEAVAETILRVTKSWKHVHDPKYGDIVTFLICGMPWHAGIVLDSRTFLHTQHGSESCVDRLDSPRWSARIHGFWRYEKDQ